MTRLLEQAIETVRKLPAEAQDEIARLVLQFTCEDGQLDVPMSAEEEASFDESLAQAERGEFVSDETARAFWAKLGL
jgi:hypothetical protein